MNRPYNQFRYSLEKKVVDLYASVAIGASGAPTLDKSKSKGVASISRTSAGLYVLTLQDKYVRLLGMDVTQVKAAGLPVAGGFMVAADAVASAKTVTFQFSGPTAAGDTAAVATDPASGTTLLLHVELSASSAI